MKIPPFLLGATLLFWGWETGLWIFALPMALLLEASRLFQWQWNLSDEDIKRIANLSFTLLLVLTIFLFFTSRSVYFFYTLLKWIPIVLFPLLIAQVYGTQDRIDIRNLFLFLSKLKLGEGQKIEVNLNYPYFILLLFSASAANTRSIVFYIGIFLLIGTTLSFLRSKRFPIALWLVLLLLAGGLGVAGHLALHELHLALEQKAVDWLSGFTGSRIDPSRKSTSIGEIGSLKLSNEILFRVQPGDRQNPPRLLRSATYDQYKAASWMVTNPNFTIVPPESNGTSWRLGQSKAAGSLLTMALSLPRGKEILSLPEGAFLLDQLPVAGLEKNDYGAVRAETEPLSLSYQIHFDPSLTFDSKPTARDLQIPDREKSTLKKILNQLQVQGKSAPDIVRAIEDFFQTQFRYSLDLTGKREQMTPLSTFLLSTKAGHCEYFATATTLLLRAAGIPARYTIGYSVHEFNPLENQYLVRKRHAHAWTMVYLNGSWQALDTTPGSWVGIEDATVSSWAVLEDLWSLAGFKLSEGLRFLRSQNGSSFAWLMIPVLLIVAQRFSASKRVRRLGTVPAPTTEASFLKMGTDSEFYLIEKILNQIGLTRHAAESFKQWLDRLQQDLPESDYLKDLQPILELHYRYRFDPAGLDTSEREKLRTLIQVWLERHSSAIKENIAITD